MIAPRGDRFRRIGGKRDGIFWDDRNINTSYYNKLVGQKMSVSIQTFVLYILYCMNTIHEFKIEVRFGLLRPLLLTSWFQMNFAVIHL